jgi:predicted class III extradiol MEMO1 family dioxygenase
MVGQVPRESIQDYGKVLSPYLLDEKTLFVFSTDFCHWGSRFGFTHKFQDEEKIYKSIEKLDKIGAELVEK